MHKIYDQVCAHLGRTHGNNVPLPESYSIYWFHKASFLRSFQQVCNRGGVTRRSTVILPKIFGLHHNATSGVRERWAVGALTPCSSGRSKRASNSFFFEKSGSGNILKYTPAVKVS